MPRRRGVEVGRIPEAYVTIGPKDEERPLRGAGEHVIESPKIRREDRTAGWFRNTHVVLAVVGERVVLDLSLVPHVHHVSPAAGTVQRLHHLVLEGI